MFHAYMYIHIFLIFKTLKYWKFYDYRQINHNIQFVTYTLADSHNAHTHACTHMIHMLRHLKTHLHMHTHVCTHMIHSHTLTDIYVHTHAHIHM